MNLSREKNSPQLNHSSVGPGEAYTTGFGMTARSSQRCAAMDRNRTRTRHSRPFQLPAATVRSPLAVEVIRGSSLRPLSQATAGLRKDRPSRRQAAFTLVELLVVLAIIAVVGAGVAVTYGRKNVDEAKDRMTLHEMGEIKKAFLNFENDNYRRLRQLFADHTGAALPTAGFEGEFGAAHPDDDQLEAKIEFYENYGLWFLMQRKVFGLPAAAADDDDDGFPEFEEYDGLAGEGWNGPYLDVTNREAWLQSGVAFPQIADEYGGDATDADGNPTGVYRLVYYAHDGGVNQPIYRRLLLVSPRGNANFDELAEVLAESGNLRGGVNEGRLDLESGAFQNIDESPYFILELLNLDTE